MLKGLYTNSEFNVTGAKEFFSNNEKFKVENLDIDEVNKYIDDMVIYLNTYNNAPKFVLTRALYSDNNNLTYARIIIRPSVSYELEIKNMREVFTIIGDENFLDNLLNSIVNWFDSYTYYAKLGVNIECLNIAVQNIINKNNLDFNLKFTLGDGLEDITDTNIIIGLDETIIRNLSNFSVFSEDEIEIQKCEKDFVNLIKECSRPYDILKIKSKFTKDLCIYQRKSINKLIRKVVTRRIDFVRVGIGYFEDTEIFSVIQRDAVTETSLHSYDLNEVVVSDNINMTNNEKKENLTKIVTYFRVLPFYKKSGLPIDTNIKEFLEYIKVV